MTTLISPANTYGFSGETHIRDGKDDIVYREADEPHPDQGRVMAFYFDNPREAALAADLGSCFGIVPLVAGNRVTVVYCWEADFWLDSVAISYNYRAEDRDDLTADQVLSLVGC